MGCTASKDAEDTAAARRSRDLQRELEQVCAIMFLLSVLVVHTVSAVQRFRVMHLYCLPEDVVRPTEAK